LPSLFVVVVVLVVVAAAVIVVFVVQSINDEKKSRSEQIKQSEGTYCIPNLQFNLFVVNVDHPGTKFDTNSQVMNRLESLISELKKKT
jgi:flagellar basal body-associated protein FliL